VNGIYDVRNAGQNCATGNAASNNAWCITDANGIPVDGLDRIMNRSIAKDRWDLDWNVKTVSLSAMDTVKLSETWTAFGGLRYDRFDFDTVAQSASLQQTRYQYS